MKNIISAIFSVVMFVTMTACGNVPDGRFFIDMDNNFSLSIFLSTI